MVFDGPMLGLDPDILGLLLLLSRQVLETTNPQRHSKLGGRVAIARGCWKPSQPWKVIWQCEVSTVEMLSAFDPIMPPLGCSSKEIIQNMARASGLKIFNATLFLMTKKIGSS